MRRSETCRPRDGFPKLLDVLIRAIDVSRPCINDGRGPVKAGDGVSIEKELAEWDGPVGFERDGGVSGYGWVGTTSKGRMENKKRKGKEIAKKVGECY